jgi:hypothetical protein
MKRGPAGEAGGPMYARNGGPARGSAEPADRENDGEQADDRGNPAAHDQHEVPTRHVARPGGAEPGGRHRRTLARCGLGVTAKTPQGHPVAATILGQRPATRGAITPGKGPHVADEILQRHGAPILHGQVTLMIGSSHRMSISQG